MNTLRFSFHLADGRVISGPVQGSGGKISDRRRLEGQQRLARAGRPLGVYEPKPGHVAVFPDYTFEGDGVAVYVDLREVQIL